MLAELWASYDRLTDAPRIHNSGVVSPRLAEPPTTMPTYEYLCSSCANAWEEVQKISEPALEVCPKCHQHTAKRQISGGNFILKGGGWYADLYSSAKPGSASKGGEDGGASSKGGEKGAEAKSDTKPPPSTTEGASAKAAPAPSAAAASSSGPSSSSGTKD